MERSHEFDVPADALWEAVTDPAHLADWLGDEVDIDVVPGGEGRVVDDGEVRHVLVDEVKEVDHRFTFTWWPDIDRGDRSYGGRTRPKTPRDARGHRTIDRTPDICRDRATAPGTYQQGVADFHL